MAPSRSNRRSASRAARRVLPIVVMVASVTVFVQPSWAAGGPKTKRVNVSSSGAEANSISGTPTGEAMSADGTVVVFDSRATNLVGGDANGFEDIFVRDLAAQKTKLVSVSTAGTQGNGDSFSPTVSADGRFVAFETVAMNLTGSSSGQILVRDLVNHTTTLVSQSSSSVEGNAYSDFPSISANGRFVAFRSSATNLVAGGTTNQQVFERDVKLGTTTLVSQSSTSVQGNGNSSRPSISGDGNSIAFSSDATNLVPGDSNANQDVFLRNQNAGTTVRVSVSSAGAQGNSGTYNSSISTGGRYIAMTTSASNLVPGDLNASSDIILRDRKTDKTKLVSLSNSGAQGNSGSFLVDPAITPNGQYITFTSVATNLVGGGTSNEQVFVRDMVNLKTKLISQSTAGVEGNSSSFDSSISVDGRFVAFSSNATNLVGNDTLGYRDIFVRGPVH